MTFSFDPTLASDEDKVRFHLGDTVDAGHLLEDETITAMISTTGDVGRAAALLARGIANSFARKVDKEIGKTKLAMSQAYRAWCEVADRLEANGGALDGTGSMVAAPMHVGGISESERTDLASGDEDTIQPSFSVGRDDHPGAPNVGPPYDPSKV